MEKQDKTGTGLDKLPGCAAKFIRLVVKKMRYRRSVQQEVEAELAAHFEDKMRECATDEEKEQKAQQLIEGFGDIKLLAILLRRAKKRCRPLWRTVAARSLQAVGALVLCFVLYIVWFFSGKPAITTNYLVELNRLVRPVADDNLNAGPLYEKAAAIFEDVPSEINELLGKKHKEVTAEQKQLIAKWLSDSEEVFELVVAGTQKPYFWRTYANDENSSEMISVLLPNLNDFRRIARSLCWRAQLSAEEGQYKNAFSDLKVCYRFGQHIKQEPFLVGQLVGMAIQNFATQALRRILSERDIDSATLANWQKEFEQMVAGEDFAVSFETEKLFLYDEIQRCFTEDRFGGGHLYLSRMGALADGLAQDLPELVGEMIFSPKGWALAARVLFFHPNKEQTREMTDRYYAFWNKVAHKTPAQIRAEGINSDKETTEIIKGNVFLQILTPAVGKVCEVGHRGKPGVEATLATIAVLRYKKDKGEYPESLRQLKDSGYLQELPVDPYTDGPLVYRRMEEGFTLYSVGPNFKDDGGEVAKDGGRIRRWGTKEAGDVVFWPVPEPESK